MPDVAAPLSVALVCITVLALAHRYAWPLLDRLVALRERAEEARAIEADPMPESLIRLADQESEPFAVEEGKRRMREIYAEERDWTKVRLAYLAERGGL